MDAFIIFARTQMLNIGRAWAFMCKWCAFYRFADKICQYTNSKQNQDRQ